MCLFNCLAAAAAVLRVGGILFYGLENVKQEGQTKR